MAAKRRGNEMPATTEFRAAPSVELGVVLHQQDRGLDRVHRAAASAQDGCTGIECALQRRLVFGFSFGSHVLARQRARAAMDRKRPGRLFVRDGFWRSGRSGDRDRQRQQAECDGGE